MYNKLLDPSLLKVSLPLCLSPSILSLLELCGTDLLLLLRDPDESTSLYTAYKLNYNNNIKCVGCIYYTNKHCCVYLYNICACDVLWK